MSAGASGAVVPEPEDPRVVAANLNVGVRLFASAVAFVFVAFIFAFFYLKAVNSNGLWHPKHTDPLQGYGIAILVCVLATTAFAEAGRRARVGAERVWHLGFGAAVALSAIVVVLQILEFTALGFGATAGGYASVFYGWTAMILVFWLGAFYWVETLLATGLRDPDTLVALRPSADACVVYLYLMATVQVIAYVLLYLIK